MDPTPTPTVTVTVTATPEPVGPAQVELVPGQWSLILIVLGILLFAAGVQLVAKL